MGKGYKGSYFAKQKLASMSEEEAYFEVKLNKREISFFKKIIEAHEHMAFVIQVNPDQGVIGLYTTSGQLEDLVNIIENLPLNVELL